VCARPASKSSPLSSSPTTIEDLHFSARRFLHERGQIRGRQFGIFPYGRDTIRAEGRAA
jgi:hypothetical protein